MLKEASEPGLPGLSVIEAGGLAAVHVRMSDEEAAELLALRFGRTGRLTRLATEKDDTFRVEGGDGRNFVLKVANPAEPPDEIDLQVKLLEHICRFDPDIPVPRAVPDRDGSACTVITDRAGQVRRVRLMTFLDGQVLDKTDTSAEQRERIGEVLARLRLATAGFSHPAADRVLAWDVKHLPGLRPLLDAVEDPVRHRRLAAAMERFCALGPRIAALRGQVLHNDFNRSNIVVDHGQDRFVTGIIDFGDAVRTAIAIDVSTAMQGQLPRDADQRPVDDLFAPGRDLLRGYLRIADLLEEELRLIPHLVMGRVIVRALISLWRARLFPENAPYILRNTQAGWGQLDWFLSRPPEAISALL